MQGVAFFDIEVVQQPKERIASIGLFFEGKILHTTSIYEFEQQIAEASCLCGHNILAHDLPHLKKAGISSHFLQRNFIDTLYLSPLLFPNKPYHRLIKDYQLMSQHLNNPVEDSKLAKDLLMDCLDAFFALPTAMQSILCQLLQEQKEFSAFIRLLKLERNELQEPGGVAKEMRQYFQGKICKNVVISLQRINKSCC